MDLELSDEHELLRSTTERFIDSTAPLASVRTFADSGSGFGSEYVRQGAELGWYAMLVPDALGGGGGKGDDVLATATLAEQRAKALQPGPFTAMNVVAHAIAVHGTDAQRREVLPDLVSGTRIATWALAEDAGTPDPLAGVDAVRKHDRLVLTGTKGLVEDADLADVVLVAAATDGRPMQVLVPIDTAGMTVRRLDGLDLTRRLCRVTFDDTAVPLDAVLGNGMDSVSALERQIDLAAVMVVAESVGAMTTLFSTTLEYAKIRTAFGRPIGSFQAVKHLLADTSLLLEASTAAATAATRAVAAGAPHASQWASMAKAFVGESAMELAHNCWQVFGGIAYTWEHDFHLYLRRLTSNASLYGQPSWHRERICRMNGL